jgi:hypothetical protein
LELLKHGRILRGDERPVLSAEGFYKVGGELKIKDGADAGILEGAIVLRMD